MTLAFAAEEHAKDIIAKNSSIASLQQQNNEMKLSVAGTNIKMRMLDDEIQVRHVRCITPLCAMTTQFAALQALKARNSEQKSAHDVEIASLRVQYKREISALEAKLAQNSSQ